MGVSGIARDITQRKQAEGAIRAAEDRYRLLFESNPQPMWVFDAETLGFLAVNDARVDHYGYSRGEFLAMSVKDIRPAEEVPKLLDQLRKMSDEKRVARVWKHRKKDGTLIEVEISTHEISFGERRGA